MYGSWSWGFLIPILFLTGVESKPENVARGKTLYGSGEWQSVATDGQYWTTYLPAEMTFPFYFLDLGALYNLSTISLFAQNQYDWEVDDPFDVHTYGEYMIPCSFNSHYPWDPLAANLRFKKRGERMDLQAQKLVRYIIIGRRSEQYGRLYKPIPLGEIEAYGNKVKDMPDFELPVDEKPIPENHYKETRKRILGGQDGIWTTPSAGYFEPNEEMMDVVLAWLDKPLVMAAVRGEGRMLLGAGDLLPKEIATCVWSTKLRVTAGTWLTNGSDTVKYVKVTDSFQPGDILLISSDDKFDVRKVYTKLLTGENSAVIGCSPRGYSARQLVWKLGITFVEGKGGSQNNYVSTSKSSTSNKYIPVDYLVDRFIKSWNLMTNEVFTESEVSGWEEEKAQAKVKELAKTYEEVMLHLAPCDMCRYTKSEQTYRALQNYNRILRHQHESTCYVLPQIHQAPGDVRAGAKPSTVVASIYADQWGYYSTGVYAKPGEAIKWIILEDSDMSLRDQYIRINAQNDDISHHNEWRRWPYVHSAYALTKHGQVCSPHGGIVFLQLPKGVSVKIKVMKGYRFPWLDIRNEKSIKSFAKEVEKYSNVPWIIVNGDSMNTMLLTGHVLSVNRSEVIGSVRHYDNAVKIIHNFRNTDWNASKTEMFVSDIEISRGYGHSGYPMMGHLQWSRNFVHYEEIKKGNEPGYIHELGHNLQVRDATLKNGGEVTNDVYRTVVRHHLLHLEPYGDDRDTGSWNSDVYNGPRWGYYKYLMSLFGTGLVGNGFTEAMRAKPRDEDAKTQFWLKQMCNETGYDLLPFHELWKFPVSNETREFCGQYPCFFPDDKYTQGAQDKVDRILKEYGKTCIRQNPSQVKFRGDIMRGVGTVRPQNIFLEFQ